eukprot:1152601-Pelagomonas_calceolata.AAC.3
MSRQVVACLETNNAWSFAKTARAFAMQTIERTCTAHSSHGANAVIFYMLHSFLDMMLIFSSMVTAFRECLAVVGITQSVPAHLCA